MKTIKLSIILAIALIVPLGACSHLQQPVNVENTGKIILITASDFKFEPNNITTSTGNSLTFSIMNVSPNSHNFTLKDPDGNTMQSVDIPARQSVQVNADFPRPGTYKMICTKTGHSELGMKGQVVVKP
ncbi:MAG: cupredoxin domain-containing protein [Syntrophorhabdaceae bacterium]